jgi:hypothetical protein
MDGGTLWNLNRFWSQKPCQTGSLAKIPLLMLINIDFSATMCLTFLRRHPLFKREVPTRVSSVVRLMTRGQLLDRVVANFVWT